MTAYEYNEIDLIMDQVRKNKNGLDHAIEQADIEDPKVLDALTSVQSDLNDGLISFDRLIKRLVEIRDDVVICDCENCMQ